MRSCTERTQYQTAADKLISVLEKSSYRIWFLWTTYVIIGHVEVVPWCAIALKNHVRAHITFILFHFILALSPLDFLFLSLAPTFSFQSVLKYIHFVKCSCLNLHFSLFQILRIKCARCVQCSINTILYYGDDSKAIWAMAHLSWYFIWEEKSVLTIVCFYYSCHFALDIYDIHLLLYCAKNGS